jgi:hypothetical protein
VFSFELLEFVVLASLVVALAVLLLKRDGKITLSWGAVMIVEVVIVAIGFFAYWILSQMAASV